MKIYRPLWSEGVFLAPAQFQQQALWEAYGNQQVAGLHIANAWGIGRLTLDTQALSVDRIKEGQSNRQIRAAGMVYRLE
ncbi:hypothetical protein RHO15_00145 [Utexia brackfieldae]|uniref:hypothetical protein n=1 Tax=Utexia brackfieldae TaxID=3074108 RepID=UPI00370D1BA9